MRATLTFLAATVLLAMMLIAWLNPASPLFWEASLSVGIMVIRGALIGVLLGLLAYTPETPWLRLLIGSSAGLLAVWVIGAACDGLLGFIDGLTLTPPVIAVFVALLETKPPDEPFRLFVLAASWRHRLLQKPKDILPQVAQFVWLVVTDIRLVLRGGTVPTAASVHLTAGLREHSRRFTA